MDPPCRIEAGRAVPAPWRGATRRGTSGGGEPDESWRFLLRAQDSDAAEVQGGQLRFSVHYRGHRVELAFPGGRVKVSSRPGPSVPITILVRAESIELSPGRGHEFSLSRS